MSYLVLWCLMIIIYCPQPRCLTSLNSSQPSPPLGLVWFKSCIWPAGYQQVEHRTIWDGMEHFYNMSQATKSIFSILWVASYVTILCDVVVRPRNLLEFTDLPTAAPEKPLPGWEHPAALGFSSKPTRLATMRGSVHPLGQRAPRWRISVAPSCLAHSQFHRSKGCTGRQKNPKSGTTHATNTTPRKRFCGQILARQGWSNELIFSPNTNYRFDDDDGDDGDGDGDEW